MSDGEVRSALLPRHLAERAVSGRQALEGERKLVTILFADVVGSTEMASELDPEDVVDILNGLFEHWVTAVHRYEGTVDKFLGDGMLALFGAPLMHEDDPRRAVLTALQIRDATTSYNRTLADISIDVRVGLNTGTVIVGNVGADARMEYTAIGDAVNVAQRVEASADAGTVFISEETRQFVEPYFRLRDAGTFELKGKREPARLWEVETTTEVIAAARGLGGRTAPLVGRTNELDRLNQILAGLDDGQGSVVALLGEPGVGKSRLVSELKASASRFTWAEGHALSYGASSPFEPIREILTDLGGVDGPELAALGEGLTGGSSIDAITAAVRLLVLNRLPAVLFIDDLHWVDDASLDIITMLADLANTDPLGLVITSRPEGRDGAVALGAAILDVTPLPAMANGELIAHLLDTSEVPTDLEDFVLERSEGNPFFTEEFLRVLLDEGVLELVDDSWVLAPGFANLAIPPTLNGLVASRIDRLTAPAKSLLQAAAVIGPSFDNLVLERVADVAVELGPLYEGGFVVSTSDQGTHSFKHVITQEVAYESLLKKARRRIHLRVAEAIEELHADELDIRAAELGRHFDIGDAPDRAIPYLVSGAYRSAAAFSNQGALELAGRAIELTDDPDTEFDLLEIQARVLGHIGRHEEEWATVSALDALASGSDQKRLRVLAAAIECRLASEYIEAISLIDEAMDLASKVDDRLLRARVLTLGADLHRRQYAPQLGVPLLEEAVALYESAGVLVPTARTMGRLAEVMFFAGDARARGVVAEALEVARHSGDPKLVAEAQLRAGMQASFGEHPEDGLPFIDEAARIATEISDTTLLVRIHRLRGYLNLKAGNNLESDEAFFAGMEVAKRVQNYHGWLQTTLSLASSWESRERFVELYEWLLSVQPEVDSWNHVHLSHYLRYGMGYRSLRWLNQLEAAEGHLRQAVRISESGLDWIPPDVMYRNGLAAVLVDQGKFDEARRVLDAAMQIAIDHQITESIMTYLYITETRLSLAVGDQTTAAQTLGKLHAYLQTPDEGIAHATNVLGAELALLEGDPTRARSLAEEAYDAEPLIDNDRFFSILHVLDVLIRATEAAGDYSEDMIALAKDKANRFLASLPDDYRETASRRPDILRILLS